MSDNRAVAASLIGEAADTITKKRPGVHGSAENSFSMIGDMWSVYLKHLRMVRGSSHIKPHDVAQMMSMVKKARAVYGDQSNADNFVDDIGYSALAGMLQLPDPAEDIEFSEKLDEFEKSLSDAVSNEMEGSLDTGIRHTHTNIKGSPEKSTEDYDPEEALRILGKRYDPAKKG